MTTATLPVLLGAGGGFLAAVLWFDLMFDVQALRLDEPDGDARLTSMADYYRRVTIEAFPAGHMVATVMLLTITGSVVQWWRSPSWRAFLAVLLVTAPVTLAGRRIIPNAQRLGRRSDPPPEQRALARRIWRDHVVCFVCVVTFLVLQVW
ncbi:MAG: hypothetical protein ABIR79_10790 [Candidatus Binatia bacterium]